MVYYFNISTRVIERAAGVCGRGILQPRGGLFYNHEEKNFATTRRKILQPRGEKKWPFSVLVQTMMMLPKKSFGKLRQTHKKSFGKLRQTHKKSFGKCIFAIPNMI